MSLSKTTNKERLNMITERLRGMVWRKRGRWHHSVLWHQLLGEGESPASCQRLGYPFRRHMGAWLHNGDQLDLEEDWIAARTFVDQKYAEDTAYFVRYAQHALQIGARMERFALSLKSKNLSQLTKAELSETYVTTIETAQLIMPFMFSLHPIDELFTEIFERALKKFIADKRLSQEDFFAYQTALALPSRKIYVLDEREASMGIAARLRRKNLDTDSPHARQWIQHHTDKYAWMGAANFEHEPYIFDHFKERITEIMATEVEKDLAQLKQAEQKLRDQQKRFTTDIADTPELLSTTKLIQTFSFLRSYRIDLVSIVYFSAWHLSCKIAETLDIPALDMQHLDAQEVRSALQGGLDYQGLIDERKQKSVSIMIENERFELTGEEADAVTALIYVREEILNEVLKGMVAYPGNISAPCKILHGIEDMKKVERGDILVISMTDPNYLPAMEKASAFVTDQGGILCHAAIVSREMKKPCLIGTKVTTKVFHDGEILEINSDTSTVKRSRCTGK